MTITLRERSASFDYLRAFAVFLVVLHHAILAYTTFAFLNPEDPTATFSPIVDGARSAVFDRMVWINDTFFMPLLFLVSGLFVWPGLARHGVLMFLRRRGVRLGVPLIVGVLVLMPLAYYPTILEIELVFGQGQSFGAFWLDFARRGFGPPGPLWFIGLLLVYNCLAALLFLALPRGRQRSGTHDVVALDNAVPFALLLTAGALVGYLAMTAAFSPLQWVSFGPFTVQIGRLLLYLVFYAGGVALGARGLEKTVLREDSGLARYWWAWVFAGLLAYLALDRSARLFGQATITNVAFAVAAVFMVLGVVSVAIRFAGRHVPILDSFAANSYGIYLVHYPVVIWLQYAMLRVSLPAIAKALLVLVASVAICWGLAAAMRKNALLQRIV